MERDKIYFADFETTNKRQYDIDGFVKVWLYYIENLDNEKENSIGISINDFWKYLVEKKIKGKKNKKITVYYHNLAFDINFIICWLTSEKGYAIQNKGRQKIQTIKTTISGIMKRYYSVSIKVREGLTIKFLDSMNLLRISVKDMQGYENKNSNKINFDKLHYETNLKEIEKKEIDHVKKDVRVIKKNIDELFFKRNLFKMTCASNAMSDFVSMNPNISKIFEPLSNITNKLVRKAYDGGIAYLNPNYKNISLSDVRSWDVNGLYSWAMYFKKMPYGKCKIARSDESIPKDYNLRVYQIYIKTAKIKKGYHPFIGTKKLIGAKKYLKNIESQEINITNIEFKVMKKYYDIEYQILMVYGFKSRKGIFKSYIDKWYDEKQSGNESQKITAKTMLNALSGKFATNNDMISFDISSISQYGDIEYEIKEEKNFKRHYLPISVFTTAYSRVVLIEAIQANRTRFVYCDTDNIYLKGKEEPKGIVVDKNTTGDLHYESKPYWKPQHNAKNARFIKPKQYILVDRHAKQGDSELIIKCSGVTKEGKKQFDYNNFKVGTTIKEALLIPKQVQGGLLLEPKDFTLND